MDKFTFENLSRIAKSDSVKHLVDAIRLNYEEKYANRGPREMQYSAFKRIYTDGNRVEWQNQATDLVAEISDLRVLALTDDKYIEPLEQVLFDLCNQFTWAWPAHSYDKDGRFDYGFIDLRVAEYSYMLAEIVHVYGDKLSADIRDRIIASIKSKIVDNYESRTFWWEEELNNWLAVCGAGIGMSYLYLFPERLPLVKDRLFSTFDRFISQIPDDGAYTEGIGYLDFAMSNFCLFYKTYIDITGETPDLVNSVKAKAAIKFMNNCAFDGGLFVPFSDGWSRGFKRNTSSVYTIKALYPETELPNEAGIKSGCDILLLRYLAGVDEFGLPEQFKPKLGTTYYESSEWLLAKKAGYNFIAKCGNNSEMHNHCDVGAFDVNKNGVKIISDPGAAVYTYQYFNDLTDTGRYSKKTLLASSWGHSVPIVNGKPQLGYAAWTVKAPYAGQVIEHSDDKFVMDIAGTYPDGEIDSLIVSYELLDESVKVKYDARGMKNITFRFVTECVPAIVDGGVQLGESMLVSKSGIVPKIDKPVYENYRTELYTVDFEAEGNEVVEEFEIFIK